eukprot:GSMAST32.ASY1.ANO1.2122.1 assembled CDS
MNKNIASLDQPKIDRILVKSKKDRLRKKQKRLLPLIPRSVFNLPVVGTILHSVESTFSSFIIVACVLILLDLALNVLIVQRISYTEIDWKAYMQEVEGPLLRNDFNYSNLKGGTGPLVYPGGFVAIYSILWTLTDGGNDIGRAQCIFMVFYLFTLFIVTIIYAKAAPRRFHPILLILLSISKRVHSIFVLRLFNDGPAMMFLYCAILCFLYNRFSYGCILFSFAFSIKMYFFIINFFTMKILKSKSVIPIHILLCGFIQIICAFPFLLVAPWAYLTQSFNLTRVFKHYWSVNFKFIPFDCSGVFTSKLFALFLFFLNILFWYCFANYRWCCKIPNFINQEKKRNSKMTENIENTNIIQQKRIFSSSQLIAILFTSNFIGICMFYFFFNLEFIFPTKIYIFRIVLFLLIELCWNPWFTDTSTFSSSLILTVVHIIVLLGLWYGWDDLVCPSEVNIKLD